VSDSGTHFHPTLTFVRMLTYQLASDPLGKILTLLAKVRQGWKLFWIAKHSSLLIMRQRQKDAGRKSLKAQDPHIDEVPPSSRPVLRSSLKRQSLTKLSHLISTGTVGRQRMLKTTDCCRQMALSSSRTGNNNEHQQQLTCAVTNNSC